MVFRIPSYQLPALIALIFAESVLATPPYDPLPEGTDYREPYRPQFHFSPESEWMNDINALFYHNGTYHMLYQWGDKIRHGGYASSPDLLHWNDHGVALVPDNTFLPEDAVRNATGAEVFSGSGVVVEGETARRITGSEKPALIAFYTGTEAGTCIAWSNDEGASWHAYEGNPVAHPTELYDPRDPCVFWYQPEEKWILAIYENGTTFYGSKDLLDWTYLSNIDFGYECPDLFELPLDDDPENQKWVLIDAKGFYLVGDFDGTRFIPEQETVLLLDQGPDFYAAQSFYPHNLPEPKIIQLAWMDHWNGGVGETAWMRNATIPVELGLVTDDGLMKVTRTPIDTFRTLHTDTQRWENETLTCRCHGGGDLLENIRSKTFDLTATFDLSDSDAGEIIFQLNNRALRYDIQAQKLIGTRFERGGSAREIALDLAPTPDGQLEIRILVDPSCLEIFADDGLFSYTEQYGFEPDDDRVGLRVTGGTVALESLVFHHVESIWAQP
jgi:levanase/fructan beta-fructosidase